MSSKDWLHQAQGLANDKNPMEAFRILMKHQDEAVGMLFGEEACAATEALTGSSLYERDTREIARIVAQWSIYALPLDEDVLSISVDMSRCDEPPLVTAVTESGEVFLFDTNEASRTNEEHLEDCRHVEASWADWQDRPGFIDLFCTELTAALTAKGLPAPHYIR